MAKAVKKIQPVTKNDNVYSPPADYWKKERPKTLAFPASKRNPSSQTTRDEKTKSSTLNDTPLACEAEAYLFIQKHAPKRKTGPFPMLAESSMDKLSWDIGYLPRYRDPAMDKLSLKYAMEHGWTPLFEDKGKSFIRIKGVLTTHAIKCRVIALYLKLPYAGLRDEAIRCIQNGDVVVIETMRKKD